MASIRSIVFFAFAAVAVQSAVAWDIKIPGLFGSSFGLNSISASNSIGGNITLEDGVVTKTVEMGPLGGIQEKIVAPVLPSIPDITKMASENMEKLVNMIGNRLGKLSGMVHDAIDLKIKAFEMILNKISMNNMQGNLSDLVKNSDGLMKKVVESGTISLKKIREFGAAVIQSAIKNTMNAGATLIDLLEKAIEAKLLLEKQAITLIRDAIEAGLHKTEGAVDVAVNQFLDAAASAGKISKDLADKLKELLKNAGAQAEAELNGNAAVNTDAGANAGANADAGDNAAAELNTDAGANAGANTNAGADAGVNVDVNVNA